MPPASSSSSPAWKALSPSVVGGLVSVPVIAVPTSVGYGASFGGIAALLGMLNSCANGVSVVNIDNGFGAACVASSINHL
jgi:NCAIR mutase (PurE)-related protein